MSLRKLNKPGQAQGPALEQVGQLIENEEPIHRLGAQGLIGDRARISGLSQADCKRLLGIV